MFVTEGEYYAQGNEIWHRVHKERMAIANNEEQAIFWAAEFNDQLYSVRRAKAKFKRK